MINKKSYNILIVGCGNIGFRHFQSIVKNKKKINIYLYDKNNQQYLLFKKYIKEKKIHQKVIFLKNLKSINKIFLCIIASTLPGRLNLIKKITRSLIIDNIIIEKIPFFDNIEYQDCIKLLDDKNINCWVNCPNRYFNSYRDLKKKFNSRKINMTINGGNWGLISNTIHYLDLFLYFNKTKKIDNVLIKNFKIKKSKRSGFKEAKASILFTIKNNFLLINDLHDENFGVTLEISDNKVQYNIFEDLSRFISINKKKGNFKTGKFKIEHQSKLTNKYLDDLIDKSKCELVTLRDNYLYYSSFINKVKIFLKKLNVNKINVT